MIEKKALSISNFAVESLVEVFNVTSLIHRRRFGRDSQKRIAQYNKVLKQLEDEESLIRHLTLFTKAMLEELDSGGIKSLKRSIEPEEPEDSIVEAYYPESISEMRARFISQIMVQSDENSLQSPTIRALLEKQEGKPFSRSMVGRVLRLIPKFLNAKVEIWGGKLRVKRVNFFNTPIGPGLERSCG